MVAGKDEEWKSRLTIFCFIFSSFFYLLVFGGFGYWKNWGSLFGPLESRGKEENKFDFLLHFSFLMFWLLKKWGIFVWLPRKWEKKDFFFNFFIFVLFWLLRNWKFCLVAGQMQGRRRKDFVFSFKFQVLCCSGCWESGGKCWKRMNFPVFHFFHIMIDLNHQLSFYTSLHMCFCATGFWTNFIHAQFLLFYPMVVFETI